MKSLSNFLFVTLLIVASSRPFQKQQDVLTPGKIMHEVGEMFQRKPEIAKVNIENGKALISVEFVSEQVNVLRGENGEVIQGDENYIQTITDVWTFEKKLDAKTLNWVLVSTKK